MANYTGVKGNKGGKLARKQFLSVDFSAFDDYLEKLRDLEANVEEVFSKAMETAADKVQQDVTEAIQPANLPAKGKYRGEQHDTENSVIRDPKPSKRGSVLEVNLGFDKTKPGAGGFLITGTPKMQPDQKLADIFQKKKYAADITKQIEKDLQEEINKRMS